MSSSLLKACIAEFIGTFTLIFVGVGAIYQNAGLLAVAFAHGLAIAVMVSATGAISGGHLNPAVTFGLLVGGKIDLARGLAIVLTVTLDILFTGPLTGAAMNPARVFEPAVASGHWTNHAVYWIGPLAGGGLAGLVYGRYLIKPSAQQ